MLKMLFSQKVGVFGSSILLGFSDKKKIEKEKELKTLIQNPKTPNLHLLSTIGNG